MSVKTVSIFVLALLWLPAAAAAQTVEFQENWGAPGFNLVSQSPTGVEVVFSVPKINFSTIEYNGEVFTVVGMPGVILPNNPGAPNLPGTGRFIAFPQEAGVSFEIVDMKTKTYSGFNVCPAPRIPYEGDDRPTEYKKNVDIYGRDAFYPAQPVLLSEAKKMRGVDVKVLGITPFQYNPVRKELVVYTDLRIKVTFQEGNGQFGEDSYRNRWFEPMLQQHLLNYASLPTVDFDVRKVSKRSEECEYMIFSPDDPDFLAWADTIKQFRARQGVVTNVFNIADIGGTANDIESKINDAYLNWTLKPVAVLMLGDLPMMPVKTWNGYCVSDNIYGDIDGDDLPELNMARLTARDASELDLLINKFMDYELTPPTSVDFYDHPIVAGGWQTERWFILCTEVIHGFLSIIEGKDPVREYAIYSGSPGSQWSTNQNTYMIVDYFGPNGLGYIPATPQHLTDWGANATRLNNDINSGAFWLLHRDHGYEEGWGEPDYSISDLANLTNDDLPFVLSINCCTGEFDYSPQCFAEAFHRMQHGALGVIAATGISYSFVNDTYVWGFHDSMWPHFDPGYGGSSGDYPLLPGFANASGKWYLAASSWPYNPSNKDETYYLFHMQGDAFTQVYSEVPQNLTVSHATTATSLDTTIDVSADAGSLIGISMDGTILGTATGTGSMQTITIDPPGHPGLMYVTVTKLNHVRYEGIVVVQSGGPLDIWAPYGTPSSVLPGPVTDVTFMIVGGLENYVPGSGLVHYRFDPADPYATAPLVDLGGDFYNAPVPGARPDSLPEFYVSAQGDGGSTVYCPSDAPTSTFTYTVKGLPELMYYDGFESGAFGPEWATLTSGAGQIQITSNWYPVGSYHVTMDSSSSGVYGTAAMTLSLDLSAVTEADLSFGFKEFNDETDPEDCVSISEDGVTFYPVLTLEGSDTYSLMTLDLAQAAASQGISFSSDFKIRFSWRDNYPIDTDGFAFDEINVDRVNMSPTIWSSMYEFPAAGGTFDLVLDAGSAFAGREYVVLGSASGSHPGIQLPSGKVLPINQDPVTGIIMNNINGPLFQNFRANLDGDGEGVATVNVNNVPPVYVGRTLTFAFTLTGAFDFVSNPVNVDVVP